MIVLISYQQKNFGLCRFLVQCTFQDRYTSPSEGSNSVPSSPSLLSYTSRLLLCTVLDKCHLVWHLSSWNALGKIISTALDCNRVAHLIDSFHCLLFCHIKHSITVLIFTLKIPPLLSSSLSCYWLCPDWPLSSSFTTQF